MCWPAAFGAAHWGGLLSVPVELQAVFTDAKDFIVGVAMRTCGFALDFFGIRAQFLAANVLTASVGLPCQTMSPAILSRWIVADECVSQNCVTECLAHESDFSLSMTTFLTSPKQRCILCQNLCFVFPVCTFPVQLLDFADRC